MPERDRDIGASVLRIGGDPNVFDIPRDWHEYLPNGGDPDAVKIRANVETLTVGRRHLRVGCHSFYSPNFSIAYMPIDLQLVSSTHMSPTKSAC
jgi:hypothetical protein